MPTSNFTVRREQGVGSGGGIVGGGGVKGGGLYGDRWIEGGGEIMI